jgi:hypothetical protein
MIPTRDRITTLAKTLPSWVEEGLPIVLLTEPDQVGKHKQFLAEHGWENKVFVAGHPKRNAGVGYARMRAVEICASFGVTSFIMADDDTKIASGYCATPLLKFVEEGKAIICAGWMSNYGLWVPDGNKIKNEPNLVIPCGGARDRVFAVNVQLAMKAGNFDPKLKTLDTQEMNRLGMKIKHLWWVHTGCHITMINKPHDPGGIQAVYENEELRAKQNQRDHEYVYKKWGARYISHPTKRMATRWLVLATDCIGPRAADALKASKPYAEADVRSAERMFSGPPRARPLHGS